MLGIILLEGKLDMDDPKNAKLLEKFLDLPEKRLAASLRVIIRDFAAEEAANETNVHMTTGDKVRKKTLELLDRAMEDLKAIRDEVSQKAPN